MVKNILIGLSLIFGISGFVISLKEGTNKTVYIDTGRVYSEFILTKELHKGQEIILKIREHTLDSLYMLLKNDDEILRRNYKNNESDISFFKTKEQEYLYKQKTFEKENQNLINSTEEKIWKQINQYVEDFSKEMGYTFILGANGQGNIMFGADKVNVTDEVIKFLNEKYEGKIK